MAAAAILYKQCTSYDIDVLLIVVTTFPLNLLKIGQMVNKWQLFFEIQDGGGPHLELWLLRFVNVAYVF